MADNETFEPKIVAFTCNWCSYAGADLAGTSRVQYAPNMRIIRVMCSGRVEPTFILEALQNGADGVCVLGCHFGDCHYISGNYEAARRMELLKKLFKQVGIDENRVMIEWVSASEGDRFGTVVNEFTDKIKELGPLPDDYSEKISLVRGALEGERGSGALHRVGERRPHVGLRRHAVEVPPHERDHRMVGVIGIEPLEPARVEVAPPQCRPAMGDVVETDDQIVHPSVCRLIEQVPGKTALLAPLVPRGEFRSHEHQRRPAGARFRRCGLGHLRSLFVPEVSGRLGLRYHFPPYGFTG